MNWKFTLKLLFLTLISSTSALAQLSCEYLLEMNDSFGDGWNGAAITITINGVSTDYTVNFDDNDGDFLNVAIILQSGDEVTIGYAPGSFEGEVSFALSDADGFLVYGDGPNPVTGEDVFSFIAECPSCPVPPTGGIVVSDIRSNRVDLNWIASDPEGTYVIEYGFTGFEVGTGNVNTTLGQETRLTGLDENADYDLYLSVICTNGDTSALVGPIQFSTPWANDVGVVAITNPLTDCSLGTTEQIRLALTNFGGQPQSLIPFDFSVNGVPGNVTMPSDGFYTGVIAVDSTEVIEFETPFDFSEPGVYTIQVWTDLDSDSFRNNDTTTFTITSIPLINELPYYQIFEEWSGGWVVSEESTDASWEYGTPSGNVISSAASGNNAWVTNLDGIYNSAEVSYLESPCLDFTGLTTDPNLGFSLFIDIETFDEFWVEVSNDDGENWSKLGEFGTGVNWYNNIVGDSWDGSAEFAGEWTTVIHPLVGLADSSDIRIRFAFFGSFFPGLEGIGIDNIFIGGPFDMDLAVANVGNTAPSGCGSPEDFVTVNILNLGEMTQFGFDVAYQVNGGTPVVENVGPLLVSPGEQEEYTFDTPFNSTGGTAFDIKAWTIFPDDFAQNDTSTTTVGINVVPLPLTEDFELDEFPAGWSTDEGFPLYGAGAHNTPTINIGDNMYGGDPNFEVELPFVGPVGDPLFISFDYRYTNWSEGTDATVLSEDDRLEVQISTNCIDFETIFTLDQSNHVESAEFQTLSVTTSDYVGQNVKIRVLATWGAGDYWLDLDNFNIATCSLDGLGTDVMVTGVSAEGASDGSVEVSPSSGVGPYTFEWSTGDTEQSISDLSLGTYTVTITDSNGCQEILDVEVDLVSSIGEIEVLEELILSPNPTGGNAVLQVKFTEASDLQLQVLNTVGQLLYQQENRGVVEATYPIDLEQAPNGLYLVRMVVGNQIITRKLIKQ
ncbi:MAG: T9SS type A sorting domain-containing protein [Bacteroidota bacterium]